MFLRLVLFFSLIQLIYCVDYCEIEKNCKKGEKHIACNNDVRILLIIPNFIPYFIFLNLITFIGYSKFTTTKY